MINVKYKNYPNTSYISVSGHAKFDDYGKDIVCAGVSTLCFTIANQILFIDKEYDLSIKDNTFIFNGNNNENISLLLKTLIDGLLMMEEEYSEYIKVKKEE